MTDHKNTQGAPSSSHDIPHDRGGATHTPDASDLNQGTKPPEVRDAGDKASNPNPKK